MIKLMTTCPSRRGHAEILGFERPQWLAATASADELAAAAAAAAFADARAFHNQHPTCLLMQNRNKLKSLCHRYRLTKR